ncbi:MAG TPA: hypothetical protein VML55_07230, partial [Planctomycetaceae bacterium]|nr:hypothetical protein [Planctomycetaceae bacterium]
MNESAILAARVAAVVVVLVVVVVVVWIRGKSSSSSTGTATAGFPSLPASPETRQRAFGAAYHYTGVFLSKVPGAVANSADEGPYRTLAEQLGLGTDILSRQNVSATELAVEIERVVLTPIGRTLGAEARNFAVLGNNVRLLEYGLLVEWAGRFNTTDQATRDALPQLTASNKTMAGKLLTSGTAMQLPADQLQGLLRIKEGVDGAQTQADFIRLVAELITFKNHYLSGPGAASPPAAQPAQNRPAPASSRSQDVRTASGNAAAQPPPAQSPAPVTIRFGPNAAANQATQEQLRTLKDRLKQEMDRQDYRQADETAAAIRLLNPDELDVLEAQAVIDRHFGLGAAGVIEGHSGSVVKVLYSQSGQRAVSAGQDKFVRVWDLASQSERASFNVEVPNVRYFSIKDIALSPDGRVVACAGGDNAIRLRDLSTGQETGRLEGHTREVQSLAFSANGSLLLSGGVDGTVRVWDVAARRELGQCAAGNHVPAVAFTSESRRLIFADLNSVQLCSANTFAQLRSFRDNFLTPRTLAVSPDDLYVVIGTRGTSRSSNHLKVWDIE